MNDRNITRFKCLKSSSQRLGHTASKKRVIPLYQVYFMQPMVPAPNCDHNTTPLYIYGKELEKHRYDTIVHILQQTFNFTKWEMKAFQ